MTTTTRNEAAERLRSWLKETIVLRLVAAADIALVDDALAAERRATVERIRAALPWNPISDSFREMSVVLDEEAAR